MPRLRLRRHEAWITVGLAVVLVTAVVSAALLIRQSVSVSPAANAPDVVFAQGDDYALINAAGFATVTIGSGGTSATFAASGIAGASLVRLGDVLKVQNTQPTAGVDYDLTLTRSAAPAAAITSFVVQLYDGAALVESWDLVADASSATFSLPADTIYDITVDIVIAAGTATGALGSFNIMFDLEPA